MADYTVKAISGGFEVVDDDLTVTIRDPKLRDSIVRGVVTVRLDTVILARDQAVLTTAKGRQTLVRQLAEKDVELHEAALVALDEAVRTLGVETPKAAPAADDRQQQAEEQAGPLLDDPDPMARVDDALRAQGFAGDTTAAKIAYLAFTSRLTRRPVNAAFVGPSSSGKSRTVEVAANLFPASAIYRLDGSSQLALIYSEESFQHRTIFLAEADSLPEDGAAASALRAIVTESRMVYLTVERQDGSFVTRAIVKEGPTGLCTTSIRPPREQFATRMLLITVPDTEDHHRAVLEAQAAAINGAHATFDPVPLRALQEWLQLAGEHRVTIPYAAALADRVPAKATRTMRDFPQLLSLIQASAILHQRHRARDREGRIIATLDDYTLVRDLVKDSYAAISQSGLTPAIRETVETAAELLAAAEPDARLTFRRIADALGLAPSSGKWRVDRALKLGYLVNDETRRSQPARIHLGDPMPEALEALPPPDVLLPSLPPDRLESSNPYLGAGLESGSNRSHTAANAAPIQPDSGAPDKLESHAEPPFPSGVSTSETEPIRRFESDSGELRCPDCGTALAGGTKCWRCDYALCGECGSRSTSALVPFCPACRVPVAAPQATPCT